MSTGQLFATIAAEPALAVAEYLHAIWVLVLCTPAHA